MNEERPAMTTSTCLQLHKNVVSNGEKLQKGNQGLVNNVKSLLLGSVKWSLFCELLRPIPYISKLEKPGFFPTKQEGMERVVHHTVMPTRK